MRFVERFILKMTSDLQSVAQASDTSTIPENLRLSTQRSKGESNINKANTIAQQRSAAQRKLRDRLLNRSKNAATRPRVEGRGS